MWFKLINLPLCPCQVLPDLYLGNFKGLYLRFFLESLYISDTWHTSQRFFLVLFLFIFVFFLIARCKRSRTTSQKQHHTHSFYSWQCCSHSKGKKFTLAPNTHGSPCTIHQSLNECSESEPSHSLNQSGRLTRIKEALLPLESVN